ncbi:hypothetical protein VHARVF571_260059 [Vibrio harveyi]|nr:hypothetical protein VHARVF571_260059 [Vibrio harveyi]
MGITLKCLVNSQFWGSYNPASIIKKFVFIFIADVLTQTA